MVRVKEEKRREEKRSEAKRREGKGRKEKRREEKKKEDQKEKVSKEDPGARKGRKIAKHCVFPMICGSAVQSHLAR